jgi:ribosomal protein L37AE/L43A
MAKHPKCPNCDLPTMRTKDWACQWCGYPLISESFQQLPKTYQEVRAERMRELAPSEKEETDVPTEDAKCPNCDLPTMRTKDWACRWCGHPLLSGSFRQISKTYQEVKAERIAEGTPSEKEEATVPTENVKPTISEEEAESIVDVPPPQVVETDVEVATDIEATQKSVPIEEPGTEPVSEAEETLEVETEAAPEAEPEPESEPEAKPERESEPEPVAKKKASAGKGSETITETTVTELCSSYQSYGMVGHDEFKDRVFRVTGMVANIIIKDTVGQYYVALTDSKPHPLGDIHCMFEGKDVSDLNQLTIGQELTIQGRYDGFVTNIILADCVINYE